MQLKGKNIGRREFVAGLGGFGLVVSAGGFANAQNNKPSGNGYMLLYIGTYTSGESKSEGIYVYKLDNQTGALSPHVVVKGVEEPSFLTVDKERKYLYAVNETTDYNGTKSGAVSAFAIDRKTGDLRFLNKQPSLGGAPCYVSISDNGNFVLVANYMGGNVAVLPVERDGRLGRPIDLEQHNGSGTNKERQESAHVHSVVPDQNDRFVLVSDLGIDQVKIYKFDPRNGKLAPNDAQPYYQTKPGAGPRHLKFHPNGKFAFVINELDMTISSLAYDERNGTLEEIHTVSTLPSNYSGRNTCADVQVSPNGAFLYGSNRGHDSIVSYRIDQRSGRLELIEYVPTQGKTPRNFAIDPTGSFLLAANQGSNSIVVFRIDERSGKLRSTGFRADVPTPVCLKLMPDFTKPLKEG